jgi:hypothetical protein
MKRMGLLLIIGAVAGLTVLSVGAVAPVPPQRSSEIEQLRNEVAALRRRVASLEERLKDGSVVVIPKEGKGRPDIIDPSHGFHRVPPHWREFEFNGMTYYIVPINNTSKSAGEGGKQVPPSPSPVTPKTADNQ